MTLAELMQQAARGVAGELDIPRPAVGVMLSATGVRIGDRLTWNNPILTQTAAERQLGAGDRVVCLYDSGMCIILDKAVV